MSEPIPLPEWQPPAPAAPKGRGKLAAATVAIVVLGGGAVASYAAFSASSGHGGAASPTAAVQQAFDDLNRSDFIGLLNDLAPGEKNALLVPVQNEISQLKRLNVLRSDADPSHLSAVSVAATGLTFDTSTIAINDNVQVVRLTGGRIAVNANATRLPLSAAFLKAAFRNGQVPSNTTKDRTIDVSAMVQQSPDKAPEIATERVNGRWYPSLFYTVAYYATRSAGIGAPSAADRIPDLGAASPQDAVRGEIEAVAARDYARVIELVSPDELPALHDYGRLIIAKAGAPKQPPFTITNVQFRTSPLPNGVRVSLQSIDLQTRSGEFSLAVTGGPRANGGVAGGGGSCVQVTVTGRTQSFCAANVPDLVAGGIGRFATNRSPLTAAQRTAFEHLFTALLGIGVDTSEVGGTW